MGFSLDKDASLFGLDDSTVQHQSKLEAAQVFSQLRRDLDLTKTVLKTLTATRFSKRRLKDTLRNNLKKLVNGDKESQAISHLLHDDTVDPEVLIDRLIIVLSTFTKTTIQNIERVGLVDIFASLFSRVIGDCEIYPELRDTCIAIFNDVCNLNTTEDGQPTENGQLLLDLLATRKAKRRRLNPPVVESFGLSETALVPPEIDDLDTPPDLIPKTVAVQFFNARSERLDTVLGDSAMLQAMKTSRQWCWERRREALTMEQNGLRTDSIIAMIPRDDAQDISFILRVGFKAGWEIVRQLEFST
ncbi:hypothetical protein CDV36_014000 [Fusarium kuroshium]|uniref:Uncharacterized protein n=1 Tax=Fusarium kuroshium TaxID=2010991 RepID=A0A3M2RJD4_9HYPO|nr:hypothetical protein CDV36_014000 [Fusarium kuroshium]